MSTAAKRLRHITAAVESERERDAREARKLEAWIERFKRTWGREPSQNEIKYR